MKIQGIEFDDDLVKIAFGRWDRDKYCGIAIIFTTGVHLLFESRSPEEANKMHPLLNRAVDISIKNKDRSQ